MSIIKEAIEAAGGAAVVARSQSIGRVSVYEWIYKDKIPAERVIPLAELTGWHFTPHQLAPLVYPNPTDGIPVEVSGNA